MRSIIAPNNVMYNVTVTRSQCKTWLQFGPDEVVGYNFINTVEYVSMTLLSDNEIEAYRAFLPDMLDVSMEH